jgi:hypothetical protein
MPTRPRPPAAGVVTVTRKRVAGLPASLGGSTEATVCTPSSGEAVSIPILIRSPAFSP